MTNVSSRASADASLRGGLVAALVFAQIFVWVALAWLFEGAVRLDVAEGAIDGPEWRLSYFRHPPFSTWLTGIASGLGPFRYVAVYGIGLGLACAAFAIVAAFLARTDSARGGWVALLAGLASPYATYVPLQVNHNIGQMPFWALILASGFGAFETGGMIRWALFGAAVGFGLWAKYAVLHLVIPLALLFLATPVWRRRLAEPGPWFSILLAMAIIAPHAFDVARNGATTLLFATRTSPEPMTTRLVWIGGFALNCALAQIAMALIALAACGPRNLLAALNRPGDRLDHYLSAAAFGPPLVVMLAAPLGVQPHYLWLTAMTIGFAAWWGRVASRAGGAPQGRRMAWTYVALSAALILAYIGVREIAPRVSRLPPYPDTDGPALAALAQTYWGEREAGPIPYIIGLSQQRGFQAAGSIVFDLPYRVRALDDAAPERAPWIDVADLKRRGALVVVVGGLKPGQTALGVEIQQVQSYPRPMRRGPSRETIAFGIIPPGS